MQTSQKLNVIYLSCIHVLCSIGRFTHCFCTSLYAFPHTHVFPHPPIYPPLSSFIPASVFFLSSIPHLVFSRFFVTMTAPTLNPCWRPHPPARRKSSSLSLSIRWTATLRRSAKSAIWPTSYAAFILILFGSLVCSVWCLWYLCSPIALVSCQCTVCFRYFFVLELALFVS
jgi:hypothetical protein